MTARKNAALTQTLLELADESKQGVDDVQDPVLRSHVEDLEQERRVQRSRWRTLKSIVGGVVAGSGLDWAGNDELRELVVDDEEASD